MDTQTPENRNEKRTSVSMSHVTSRYLKPRIASCHDRCKDGMKDETEIKKPTRRMRVRKKPVKWNKVKRTAEPVERKFTKTQPKPKPFSHHKYNARDEPVKVNKRVSSLPSKRIDVSVYGLLTNRKLAQNEPKLAKNHVKAKADSSSVFDGKKKDTETVGKSTSVEQVAASKVTHTGSSSRNHQPVSPLKDEHSMTNMELKQVITEKITEMTEMTSQEAENAELELVPLTVEIESPVEDEHTMTNSELKQLISEKITEMNLQEAENAELEFVPLTVEIESPTTVTAESTNILTSSESSQSDSDKEDLEEHENINNEEVIVSEDDYEMETSESNSDYRMIVCEDNENGGSKVKLTRGRVVKSESEDDSRRRLKIGKGKIPDNKDDGPTRLKFRRGTILEDNGDDSPTRLKFRRGEILDIDEDDGPTRLKFRQGKVIEDEDDQSIDKINFKKKIVEEATDDCESGSETVTLKHQEMQEKKEAQELNRVIEETASKLEIDRKTKVEALVGAFETVISLQDEPPPSE